MYHLFFTKIFANFFEFLESNANRNYKVKRTILAYSIINELSLLHTKIQRSFSEKENYKIDTHTAKFESLRLNSK